MHERKLNLKFLESRPCTQPWGEMRGTLRERHCESCDKQVHNFAAMTAKQIEELARDNQGRLCARRVLRADGSLVTLDVAARPSITARATLAASLMIAAASAAPSQQDAPATARLSGTILVSDGTEAESHAVVALLDKGRTVATTHTDEKGQFNISAEPGRYDILIWRNILFRQRIPDANLHAGEQSLQPIYLSPQNEDNTVTVTLGDVIAQYRYPVSYLFKHPIRYLKNIRHQF